VGPKYTAFEEHRQSACQIPSSTWLLEQKSKFFLINNNIF